MPTPSARSLARAKEVVDGFPFLHPTDETDLMQAIAKALDEARAASGLGVEERAVVDAAKALFLQEGVCRLDPEENSSLTHAHRQQWERRLDGLLAATSYLLTAESKRAGKEGGR